MAVSPEVRDALATGRPVVALESTLIAHGLPRPVNREVACGLEDLLRAQGVVPATVAVVRGTPTVGLDPSTLAAVADDPAVLKLSARDLAPAMAAGATGATTVASTALLAARAGVRVFATGGLGGVHLQAARTFDESADLGVLASTPIVVVCAGVKSMLDVGATLERLETLSVPVLGYRTSRFPGFYLSESGHLLDWRVEHPVEVADVLVAAEALGSRQAVVVANPVPPAAQLDPALHDRVLADSLSTATRRGVRGKAVTPFLLDYFHRETGGASLAVNVAVVRHNTELAGRIATALAARRAV
jgi:pseudouridine-5'-phosphate glycosidase